MRKEKLTRFLEVFALTVSFVISTIPAVAVSAQEETPIFLEEYVPMRDGVRLYTRIFLPDPDVWGPGPYPAIVTRTPYGIGEPGVIPSEWPGEPLHGYAYVRQDTRGRYYSEGVDRLFYDDTTDAYDTIEWIASQDWCNGKVGQSGGSALGITTYLGAGGRPPHLVCAHASVASANLYNDLVYDGGALRFADTFLWVLQRIYSLSDDHLAKVVPPSQWEYIPQYQWDCGDIQRDMLSHMNISFPKRPVDSEWFMHLPLKGFHPNFTVLQPWGDEVLSHPSEDDFRDHLKVYDTIDVPMMHIGGWYDFFAKDTIDAFVALQNKSNQKLIMAPGTHGNLGGSPYNNYYAWFDYWLKGVDTGIMDKPPVSYYCLGANEWRWADQWPPGGIEYTNYYLHSGGVLDAYPCHVGEEPESYVYDPMNPVLTWGGRNLALPAGSFDQRPVEAGRDDILIYTTDVLTEDVEITGPIKAVLRASSNCTDTDFTVKLIDIHPDGSAMLVIDNIIRARYRESMREPVLMEPGQIYEFTINLGDISYLFKTGHRIQVDISSSNFPKHDRNLNSGGELYTETEVDICIANNTVYHDAGHPSCITLPVMQTAQQREIKYLTLPSDLPLDIEYDDESTVYVALFGNPAGLAEINSISLEYSVYEMSDPEARCVGVAIDDNGDVWVTEGPVAKIAKFNSKTKTLEEIALPVAGGDAVLSHLGYIWTTYGGYLHQIDINTNTVVMSFLIESGLYIPYMVADGDCIWMSGLDVGKVLKFNITNCQVNLEIVGFDRPLGIAVDSDYIYVAENSRNVGLNGKIAKVNKTSGEIITRLNTSLITNKGPYMVYIDSYQNLWWTDNSFHVGVIGEENKTFQSKPYCYFMTQVKQRIWFSAQGSAYVGLVRVPNAEYLIGDLNGDCKVGAADIILMGKSILKEPGNPNYHIDADLNGDGKVGAADIIILGKHILKKCTP